MKQTRGVNAQNYFESLFWVVNLYLKKKQIHEAATKIIMVSTIHVQAYPLTAVLLSPELVALLNLSSWCLMMVEWIFLAVPWGCLQFVIVVFPDHTHLLHCVVSLSKNINPSLVLVQPRKTRPFITERLLMGRKESNQTNKQILTY